MPHPNHPPPKPCTAGSLCSPAVGCTACAVQSGSAHPKQHESKQINGGVRTRLAVEGWEGGVENQACGHAGNDDALPSPAEKGARQGPGRACKTQKPISWSQLGTASHGSVAVCWQHSNPSPDLTALWPPQLPAACPRTLKAGLGQAQRALAEVAAAAPGQHCRQLGPENAGAAPAAVAAGAVKRGDAAVAAVAAAINRLSRCHHQTLPPLRQC